MNKELKILILFSLVSIFYSITLITATDFSYNLNVNTNYNNESMDVRCNITTDNNLKTIKLDNNDKDNIEKQFKNYINISCDRNFNNLQLQVLNEDKVIKTITKTNLKQFHYNLSYHEVELDLEILNYTDCKINLDGLIKEIDKPQLKEYFLNTFSFSCKYNISQAEMYIADIPYYDKFEEIKSYSYDITKTISKPYITYIYFNDMFNKTNKCVLTLDNKDKVTKTFTKDQKRKDWNMKSKVNNIIQLNCEHPIKNINILIDDRQYSKEIYHTSSNNTKSVTINIKDIQTPKETIKVPTIEPQKPKPISKPTKPIVKTTIIEEVKENKTIINESIETKPIIIEKEKSFISKLWDWLF